MTVDGFVYLGQPAGVGDSGGGGYAGVWDSGTAYTEGDIVSYGNASYGAAADSTNVTPVATTNLLSGTPADLTVSDGGDYELGIRFTVSAKVRLTHLCFYKSSLQANAPHALKLWDTSVSTSVPIATATAPGELTGSTGVQAAPIVADLLPGRTYIATVTTGTGSDTGYVRTTGVSLPITVGAVTADAFLFSMTIGSVAAVTTGTTNFWVWPRWEQPAAAWVLLARADPVGTVAGATSPGDHKHAGADITSGAVPYARLPVGTVAGTVVAGDDPRITPNALASGESTMRREDSVTASAVSTVSGNLRLAFFTATKTETTTQVRVGTGTTAAAATPTLCRIGLFLIAANGDGTLVASTANDTALFAAASTSYTRSWTTPYAKVAGQRYAVGLLVVSGAATPTLNGAALASAAEGAIAPRITGNIAAMTDLPSSFVAGDLAATAVWLYAAVLP